MDVEQNNDGGEDLAGGGDAPVLAPSSPSNANPGEAEAPEEQTAHAFIRALQFDLVADKIVSLINFEDMKALSHTSRDCFVAVRKTKEFSDRARFIVCKEVISSDVLKECVYEWKHISLDLTLPVEVVDLIEDILESVKSLSLLCEEVKDSMDMVQYLSKIFKNTNALETLHLDTSIFNCILHDVLSDVGVQTLLSKLQCLDIQRKCTKPRSVCYIDGAEDDGDTPFQRNFLQISMMPLHLKRFVFGKVMTLTGSETDHVKFIPRIVQATKDTLEELELHMHVWKFDEMKGIRCPKLKQLMLSADGLSEDEQIVKIFLKNQPPLEELVIEMTNEFPFSVLQVLQGITSKMKKLHLKAKMFSGTSLPVDWSFLQTMSELRDFHIRKPFSTSGPPPEIYGLGNEIIDNLPVGIEKLSLQGFDSFWKDQVPAVGNIGTLLSRFKNLKELNLLRSAGAVTDEGLQTLISNNDKLTALTFSHCHDVTDFGLSGLQRDADGTEKKVGVSIRDLKGLIRFKIRSCPNVTSDCLEKEIEFDYLRYFDYYRNVQLPKSFLMKMIQQNPCLEEIALHFTSYDDIGYVSALKKEIKEARPRLHLVEILEQSNWEDMDSDSDASSIHADGDSDFSGGGYQMNNDEFADYDDDYDDSPDFDDEDDYDAEDYMM